MAINGVQMITDRSISDVILAKNLIKKGFQNMTEDERNRFLAGLKGAYNCGDVNRVETAIKYLVDTMLQIYYQNFQLAEELGVEWTEVYEVPYNPEDYKNIIIKCRFLEQQAREQQDKAWEKQLKNTRKYYQVVLLKTLTATIRDYCMEED